MTPDKLTPVTVIGGYLGAGKTTLINHLLRNANGKRLAILVNEFGALPIDEDLIETKNDDIISLTGGCVCCSYGNDLFMAMAELAKLTPQPDHIVLEASGVALPGAIASSVSLVQGYRVEGIVVMADCETIRERAVDKFMGDTITRQISDADIILLNKTDLVSDEARQTTRFWFDDLAPTSLLVETSQACVDPAIVLSDVAHGPLPAKPGRSHNETNLITRSIIPPNGTDAAHFADDLISQNPGLVRAKGFVRATDGTMQTLQIVGKRFEISPAPSDTSPGVVIICLPGE